MADDEEGNIRKKLKEAFFVAFDRWGAQSFDKLVNPEIRKDNPEALEGMLMEDLFMSKRVFIPSFFRHVTREVMANADSIRQLRTIAKASLATVLKPEGVSVKELETKTSGDDLYTRRNVQHLLHERYGNTFYETESTSKVDGNVVPHSSVFSPHSEVPLSHPISVRKLQLRDKVALVSNARTMEWLKLNAMIETVFPERLQFLLAFRKLCAGLLLEMGDHSKVGKVLAMELAAPTEIFVLFANHMLSIASIAWFNGRREEAKKKLIHDGFPFEFTEEDARLACSLLRELLDSDVLVADNVLVAGAALVSYGSPDGALLLYRQCVGLPGLEPLQAGILHENMATIHRNNQNPKLMVQEMKRAIASYREAQDDYRLAVALKNLGEAEWMLEYPERARGYFSEAERLGETLKGPDNAKVFGNLAVAAMRIGQRDLEVRYLKRALELAPDDWSTEVLQMSARLGELTQ